MNFSSWLFEQTDLPGDVGKIAKVCWNDANNGCGSGILTYHTYIYHRKHSKCLCDTMPTIYYYCDGKAAGFGSDGVSPEHLAEIVLSVVGEVYPDFVPRVTDGARLYLTADGASWEPYTRPGRGGPGAVEENRETARQIRDAIKANAKRLGIKAVRA